ncbi:hypothetical protein GGI43DRAFT_121277 [Trichoderma evansii]
MNARDFGLHVGSHMQSLTLFSLPRLKYTVSGGESYPRQRRMEGLQDWPDIYSAASDCDELFDKCLGQIAEPRTSSLLGEPAIAIGRLARDHQARFQAWSSYLGVFAEQNVCLDRRLSNSKDIQGMVTDLLRIVAVSLRQFLSMIQIIEDVSNHGHNLATDLVQTQESIEGAIDRLHRLGVTIRQSSTAGLISRVKAFSSKILNSSLEEISFLMVKHLYPTASLSLQRLLGRSILERYFNLKYREEHQRRLATHRSPVKYDDEEDQSHFHIGRSEASRPITRKDSIYDKITKCEDQMVDSDAVLSRSGTRPSTLQADEFQRKTGAENRRTALSVISRTSSVPLGDISYPKPPKPSEDGESRWATCSWCSEFYLIDHFQNARWWRRHVDRDFRPYICLSNTCSVSPNAFDRFSLWLQHMEEHHSTSWIATTGTKTLWRCDVEHKSPELFSNDVSLKDHMRAHHLESFTESQLAGIARRSSIRISGSKDVCPLCGFDASKVPLVTDQSNDSQHPSRNKRKRPSKCVLQENLNISVQAKRRKVHFHDQAESNAHESLSSSESDLDLTRGPATEPILPQIKAQLQRKQLSRHIATHLKALSFMSLRLNAFQEQFEGGDQGSITGDEQDTNEGGEQSGFDTELEALSLSFSDKPGSPPIPTDDVLEYLYPLRSTSSATPSQNNTTAHQKPSGISAYTYLKDPVTLEDILDHQRSGPSSSTCAIIGDRVLLLGSNVPNIPSSLSASFIQQRENELAGIAGMFGMLEAPYPDFPSLEILYRDERSSGEAWLNLGLP